MLCLNQTKATPPKPISRLFRHVAFWQAMTFLMLVCAVWGLHTVGPTGEVDPDLYLARSIYLSLCIGLVGFITVAHTYVQQRRVFEGLVISCSYCNRIRLEGTHWEALESYLSRRSLARFSHGICPDCLAEKHPDAPCLSELTNDSLVG